VATSYTIGEKFSIGVDNGNSLVPFLSLGGNLTLVTETTNQGVEAPPILDVLNGDLAIQFRPHTMYRLSPKGNFKAEVSGKTVKVVLIHKYTGAEGDLRMRKFVPDDNSCS
jgi:hypothetical protein